MFRPYYIGPDIQLLKRIQVLRGDTTYSKHKKSQVAHEGRNQDMLPQRKQKPAYNAEQKHAA